MTEPELATWLSRYGAAWEARDPEAAAALFTEDAEYFWTPFGDPNPGTRSTPSRPPVYSSTFVSGGSA